MQGKTLDDVRAFWEEHPLFAGESDFTPGSREFFEQHRRVVVDDCFAGRLDPRIFPSGSNRKEVLDLGCGPGFWVVALAENGAEKITAADLTRNAVVIAGKRAAAYGIEVECCQQNAESMSFGDGVFSHVNCQGVIHHTPDTAACVREIARVLRHDGTAVISVYYRNIFLRMWPLLRHLGKTLSSFGAKLRGRGREAIYATAEAEEIVRLYDGAENPIGKAFSRQEMVAMVSLYFDVEDVFFHFFPARSLPFRIPQALHGFLDRRFGFLIYVKCRKKAEVT